MKLYITTGSPYARMARIVVLEKDLGNHVEIDMAQTRTPNSPYYAVNPSGRVPYLVRDDGVGLEELALICAWLDHSVGKPAFDLPAGEIGWEARRLEALARSMLDGLSVWGREVLRPQAERSPGVIRHETDRASRMIDLWEAEIDHPWMCDELNIAQITLGCALGLEARNPDFRWRPGHVKLTDWFGRTRLPPVVRGDRPAIGPVTWFSCADRPADKAGNAPPAASAGRRSWRLRGSAAAAPPPRCGEARNAATSSGDIGPPCSCKLSTLSGDSLAK